MKPHAIAVACLLAAPCAVPAGIIDVPDAGAGITTLSDAIAIAQPGDTIRIAAGTYVERNTLAKSNITIEGMGEVVLRSSTIECDPDFAPALAVTGASGVVLLNLRLEGSHGSNCTGGHSAFSSAGTRALTAVESDVLLDSCSISGGFTSDGARFESCSITAIESSFVGSAGRAAFANTGTPGVSIPATDGGDGLELLNCTTTLDACEVRGGRGGNGAGSVFFPIFFIAAGDGGTGIRCLGADTLELEDSLVRGGDGGGPGSGLVGGAGGCGITGTSGLIFAASGSNVLGGDAFDPPGGGPASPFCGFGVSSAAQWQHYE